MIQWHSNLLFYLSKHLIQYQVDDMILYNGNEIWADGIILLFCNIVQSAGLMKYQPMVSHYYSII